MTRRAALAVGLALLLLAGWWMWPARATHVPPEHPDVVDLASEAARVPASAPGLLQALDARTGASAGLASSASAPTAERCGIEQSPEYGTRKFGPLDITVMTKPGGLGYAAAQTRIDAALRASADPFDRAVADLVNVGDMRTPAAALDVVVQAARPSGDPRLYALALAACKDADARFGPPIDGPPPPPSCSALNVRRWAQIDPGNGTPWLEIIREAWQAQDADAQADAWAHLAAAQRFDSYKYAAAGAVLRRMSGDPQDAAAADDLASRAVPMNTVSSTLAHACQRGPGAGVERLAQCQAIATTLFQHSDEQMLRAQGASLTFAATGDPSRRDLARAERLHREALDSGTPISSPCELQRREMALRLRSAQVGEVQALREAASMSVAR